MTIITTERSPFTRHGHLVAGFSAAGWDEPNVVARCGGPGICGECATDAAAIRAAAGVDREARLGYATTDQLLRELVSRCETGGTLGLTDTRSNRLDGVIMLLGDVKEQIGKIDPALLAYSTVTG
jgi:hypothetical protein